MTIIAMLVYLVPPRVFVQIRLQCAMLTGLVRK